MPSNARSIELYFLVKKLNDIECDIVSLIKSFFILTEYRSARFEELFFWLMSGKIIIDNVIYLYFPLYNKNNIFSIINYKFLRIIEFGQELSNIDDNLFKNCFYLQNIYFPPKNVITYIGIESFKNCYKLENIFSEINCSEIFRNTFVNCFKLEKIKFGNDLMIIEQDSFLNCLKLQEVYIPQSIISFSAFKNCNIKNAIITNDHMHLKEYIFINCYIKKYTVINDSTYIFIIIVIFSIFLVPAVNQSILFCYSPYNYLL